MQMTSPLPEATARPRFSLRSLFVAVTAIAICMGLFAALAAYLNKRAAAKQANLARLAELDKVTVVSIVERVEGVRAKLGRAPKDQAELEFLLGRQMPVVHDGEYQRPISYLRTGDNSFMLQYELWDTDDWIYDSRTPTAGWVQHWY